MLREGEKEGKTSWSGGAVHFFCYSFDRLFRKLFRKADTVVCGGPWNEDTSAAGDLGEKNASRSDAVAGADDPRRNPGAETRAARPERPPDPEHGQTRAGMEPLEEQPALLDAVPVDACRDGCGLVVSGTVLWPIRTAI